MVNAPNRRACRVSCQQVSQLVWPYVSKELFVVVAFFKPAFGVIDVAKVVAGHPVAEVLTVSWILGDDGRSETCT